MLFILFNCGKYRQIVSLKQLQLNLALSCDCTAPPTPSASPSSANYADALLPFVDLHTHTHESRFRFSFSFPFQCVREAASICQLTIGNRLRQLWQLAGAACNTGNIIIYHNKWHFSSGVCDCAKAKAKATAGPSRVEKRRTASKSRPAKRSHSAGHKSAGPAKVADMRNGNGCHLSNFNGHANRAFGLSSNCLGQLQPTPAGPSPKWPPSRRDQAGQRASRLLIYVRAKLFGSLNTSKC